MEEHTPGAPEGGDQLRGLLSPLESDGLGQGRGAPIPDEPHGMTAGQFM